MNQYEESARGARASALLADEMFKETIAELRQGIMDKWRAAPIRDIEGQHSLKLMDKLLSDIVGYIQTVADTGKMAEIQLEKESKVANLRNYGIK